MTPTLACAAKSTAAQGGGGVVGTNVTVTVEASTVTSVRDREQRSDRVDTLMKVCESGAGGKTSSANAEPERAKRSRQKSVRRMLCLYKISDAASFYAGSFLPKGPDPRRVVVAYTAHPP